MQAVLLHSCDGEEEEEEEDDDDDDDAAVSEVCRVRWNRPRRGYGKGLWLEVHNIVSWLQFLRSTRRTKKMSILNKLAAVTQVRELSYVPKGKFERFALHLN
jgi:hypothetical protein